MLSTNTLKPETQQKIETLLNSNKIVLFMKGSPEQPQCGFSAQAISILQHLNAKFAYFDVLSDREVRDGIKIFGNWPTIPQLYVNRELVGGSDIMTEMFDSGELETLLK